MPGLSGKHKNITEIHFPELTGWFLSALLIAAAAAGTAFATPDGSNVEFKSPTMGKVVFVSKAHISKGLVCRNCHPQLFQMKRGLFHMTKEEHGSETGCGACHNGISAFSQKDPANCGKCHKKKTEAP